MTVQSPPKQPRKRGCGWWLLIGIIMLFACTVPLVVADRLGLVPRLTPTITPIPATFTATPLPTSTVVPARLGSTHTVWKAQYGAPGNDAGYNVFGPWDTMTFSGDAIQHIERLYDPPISLATVQADIAALLPADAIMQYTSTPADRPSTTIELYHSPSLAADLPADAWLNAEPGQFIVIYKHEGEAISRVIIATGNNP